jgi:hypothetical protein
MATSNEKRGTLAVLALIFGIAAIVTSWVPFVNYLSLLMAIAAMVIGVVELKRIDRGTSSSAGRGFTITGIILGAVAVVLGIVLSFILSLLVGGVWGYFNLGIS